MEDQSQPCARQAVHHGCAPVTYRKGQKGRSKGCEARQEHLDDGFAYPLPLQLRSHQDLDQLDGEECRKSSYQKQHKR